MRLRQLAAAAISTSVLLAAAPMPDLTSLAAQSAEDAVTSTALRLLPTQPGILAGDLGTAPQGDALEVAAAVLAAHADALGVDADRFAFDHVRTSNIGTHVRGTEVRDGVKVFDSSVSVHTADGRVVRVAAEASDLPGRPVSAPIGDTAATAAAFAATGVTSTFGDVVVQRWLVARDGALVDVYRVNLVSLAPAVAAAVDVDAATGAVLEVHDSAQHADAEALVFFPNPMVMSGNFDMRQVGHHPLETFVDTDVSPEADAELETRTVREYDESLAAVGNLTGPWVDVFGPGSYADGAFPVTKSDPRFEGVNIYVNIDTVQRYFREELGLTEVNAEPQTTIAFPVVGFDNAFYQPANDLLFFGAGGVDDGEDADVVIHEYGHAIHDDQVPGWGRHPEGGAMGEGFGDLLAGAYYARTHGAVGIHCFADWDGSAIQNDHEPCLRPNDDDTRFYPQDLGNQVHQDGEMWSAFIMRLRPRLLADEGFATIGRQDAIDTMTLEQHVEASDRVLKLLLSSHELLDTNANFQAAIDALIQAAELIGLDETDADEDGVADEVARYREAITFSAAETTMPYTGAPYGG